ncbi:D-alanyl-D-alanine carboxypeptidase [Candidatus Gracilibacteria bacterium]|nr:D-alanyl-D-alanine carboxypeptidase [Candidatus Gracilibacteria bacterium]
MLSLNSGSAPIPQKISASLGPVLEAPSVFAVDVSSGAPLFTKDIFTRRSIASITKLVTAMVILDSHTLDEVVTVSSVAAQAEGSHIGLLSGEKITIEQMMTGMLVNSGNDAATAFAIFDSGSEAAFIGKMNAKVRKLGLTNTHFSNAKGFDDNGNYSNAFETAIFARAALEYPFIRQVVKIKTGEVSSVDGKQKHKLESTNQLLENPYYKVMGLKTGSTPAAGESFVALFETKDGHEILSIVLGSPDRFKETKLLLDWITRSFKYS